MSINNTPAIDSEFTVGESFIGEGIINYKPTNNMNTENTASQTLFRFVSLRSPQLSDDKDQDKRFILVPEQLKTNTHFYVPVTTGSGSKQRLLKECSDNYKNTTEFISDVNYLKTDFSDLYNFAVWVARNRSTCTYEEFIAKKTELLPSVFAGPESSSLWNNLIYQVVTQKDFYIKEVIMQILLALHTLSATNEDEFKLLIAARVVLPKELMLDENSSAFSSASRIASTEPKQTPPSDEMKKQQEITVAKMKLARIENLKKNLSAVEKQYNKEYQAEYKIQDEAHQARIAPMIEEYNEAVAAAKEEYCGVRPPGTEYNPEDPCQQPKEVRYPTLPKFEFNFRDQVVAETLVESLKPESVETLLDVLGYKFDPANIVERSTKNDVSDLEEYLEGKNTFSELTSVIDENVQKLNTIIAENTQGNEEVYTSIGGVIIPAARTISVPFTYQVCPKFVYKMYTQDLALTVPDSSWDVSYISYQLIPNNSPTTIDGDHFVKSRTGNTIFLNDMHYPGVDFYTIQDATLRVKIIFSNGRSTQIEVPGVQARACSSGRFELEVDQEETPVENIEDENNFIPSGFGFKNIGVADYLKVEQSTHAYVEGEVANIENIMAREYREKSTRKLRRSENTTTKSSDTEREQLSDTTTANRYEMQTEIAKMMQEATDTSAFANASMSFGSGNYTLSLGANYANHKSKEESTRQAVTQAQDVTSRAMDRIVNKVHEERIEKIIEEFEENNSHGFDNRKGDKHVVGVYRWVDKLMKNQIYNYGKRMMFEFMVPEPAKLHLLGMTLDKSASQTSLIKPEDPRATGNMQIANYSDLSNDSKLKYWASKYNVDIDKKPEEFIYVGKAFSNTVKDSDGRSEYDEASAGGAEIQIPENYVTVAAIGVIQTGGEGVLGHYLRIGGEYMNGTEQQINNFYQVVPVSFSLIGSHAIDVNASVKCKLTPEAKDAWQQKTFKAIIDAYEEALADYNSKLEEEKNKAVEIKESNPNFYRQIEKTILRKNCISYMSDRTIDSTHGYGLSGLTTGSTFKDHETNLTAKLDKYTAFVKFMEQAFEWDNLSYHLYPFYWGNKQNWLDLYQAENTDPLFRAFLQSGMARVVVTVRPGFEDVVKFYLATGKIWNGGEVPVIGDDLYLSLVDEMKEPKGKKEGKAWLTRLPTTLNILQAESIGLKVAHALPFTTENPDDFEVPSEVITEDQFNFENNDHLLGVQPASSSDKIISGDWA